MHVKALSGNRTYAELGGAQNALKAQIETAKAAGTDTTALDKQLADLNVTRETVFKGETLRGLLLNAYAFDTMGRIAGIAAVAAFSFAGLMLLLVALGTWHLRRTPADTELHVPGWHPEAVTS